MVAIRPDANSGRWCRCSTSPWRGGMCLLRRLQRERQDARAVESKNIRWRRPAGRHAPPKRLLGREHARYGPPNESGTPGPATRPQTMSRTGGPGSSTLEIDGIAEHAQPAHRQRARSRRGGGEVLQAAARSSATDTTSAAVFAAPPRGARRRDRARPPARAPRAGAGGGRPRTSRPLAIERVNAAGRMTNLGPRWYRVRQSARASASDDRRRDRAFGHVQYPSDRAIIVWYRDVRSVAWLASAATAVRREN